eukprot:jgi/Mesvir1/21767/Mv04169-RA.2
MPGTSNFIYAGLCVAQFLTFCSYVVVTAGAALLQKKANTLKIWDGLTATETAGLTAAYNDVFQSTQYIIPYPKQPEFQFQYEWFIIEFELFIFLITATCTLFPKILTRVRPVALTLMSTALVLVFDNINGIFFLLRNDTAKAVFEEYRIATAQAGLIMVGISNGLTIFFMGLYQDEKEKRDDLSDRIESSKVMHPL